MRLLCFCFLLALQVEAVELSLIRTNLTLPAGRTFQVPLTASDAGGGPLTFSIVSSSSKAVTGAFAAASNRSLVLNVTGVDATNAPFTGDIVLQLTDDLTSNTVARIVDLVSSNFYNGQTFHRVLEDFICQAGNTNGGTGVSIDDEYAGPLTYVGFGQLGLAKSSDFFGNTIDDSADSEFFITDADLSVNDTNKPSPRHLTFQYPIFGQVTRGFDVLTSVMATPVTGQTPVTPPIINTATIITNSQDAVLRVSAAAKFTGTATITVRAMNALSETATQTFTVKVIPNTVNDPAFFGSIPASIVITQYTAAVFDLPTTDLDGDNLTLGVEDLATGRFPTNFSPSIDGLRTWFVPDLAVTGTVNFLIGVQDNPTHAYDTQHFSITVVPTSGAQTMTLLPTKGSLAISSTVSNDHIKVAGTFSFNAESDHAFADEDIIVLTLGNPDAPFRVELPPDAAGHKLKNGILKFKTSGPPSASAQFNTVKGTFKLAVGKFSFPTAITNQVEVAVAIGNDAGSDTRVWTQTKPGTFTFPKP